MYMKPPKPIPRKFLIVIIVIVFLIPMVYLSYAFENDIGKTPREYENEVFLTSGGPAKVLLLGNLPFNTDIIFKLTRVIASNLTVTGYIMADHEYSTFISGEYDPFYFPLKNSLTSGGGLIWVNLTTTHEAEYFIVIEPDDAGQPATLEYWIRVKIPRLFYRSGFSIVFSLGLYFLAIPVIFRVISSWRIKRYRRARKRQRDFEEVEHTKLLRSQKEL